jgi:hypothetical protein
MSPLRVSTSVLLLTALTACGHMPVTSLLKLSKVDFATTDPQALRAAVAVPDSLLPQRVVLRLTGRIDKGPDQREKFQLEEFADPALLDSVTGTKAGLRIAAYRLTAADAARLSAFRTSLFRQKAASGGVGELEMTIHPEACLISPPEQGPVLATTYLKTSETGTYVALARDFDLRTIDPDRDLVATAPSCPPKAPKS